MRSALPRWKLAFCALAWLGQAAFCRGAGDPEIIQMLRDAQVTVRAAMRHGHANVQLVISKQDVETAATVDGLLAWSDGDFLLKYKVADPSRVRFKGADDVSVGWGLLLRTRDAVRTFNPKTAASYTREAKPGAFDPIFNLNPWVQLFGCCPPNADPAFGGRLWIEIIGPHPAMGQVAKHSKFEYVTLPNGDIKQTRRDQGGWVSEIVFAREYDYLVSSLVQVSHILATFRERRGRYFCPGRMVVK